jgi:hypothetical protein
MEEFMKEVNAFVSEFDSQKDAAAALGITPAYLSDILNRRCNISDRIAAKFGYEWRIVRIGPVPHPEDATDAPALVERKLAPK